MTFIISKDGKVLRVHTEVGNGLTKVAIEELNEPPDWNLSAVDEESLRFPIRQFWEE